MKEGRRGRDKGPQFRESDYDCPVSVSALFGC